MKIGISWVLILKEDYHRAITDTIQLLGLNTLDQAKSKFYDDFELLKVAILPKPMNHVFC